MNTEQRLLDTRALAYVDERLEHGCTFSQLVRKRVNLAGGTVSTFVPPGVDELSLYAFREGGKFQAAGASALIHGPGSMVAPIAWAEAETVDTISTFLRRGLRRVLLLENALASRTDPVVAKLRSSVCFSGDDVLHVLRHLDADDPGAVLVALKEARTVPEYVAAGCVLDEHTAPPQHGASLSTDDLDGLASRVAVLLIGAYDGESFVLWERRDRPE